MARRHVSKRGRGSRRGASVGAVVGAAMGVLLGQRLGRSSLPESIMFNTAAPCRGGPNEAPITASWGRSKRI